jgi:hypothetical protein
MSACGEREGKRKEEINSLEERKMRASKISGTSIPHVSMKTQHRSL